VVPDECGRYKSRWAKKTTREVDGYIRERLLLPLCTARDTLFVCIYNVREDVE
jgi:hypothetical protein